MQTPDLLLSGLIGESPAKPGACMGDRHLRLVQASQQQGRQNEMFNDMLRGYATMLLAAGRDRASVGKRSVRGAPRR